MNLFRETRTWTDTDRSLRDTMSGMILNFAASGKPAPNWPMFEAKAPKVMLLDETVGVAPWPNAKALPVLAGAGAVAPPPPPVPASRPRD